MGQYKGGGSDRQLLNAPLLRVLEAREREAFARAEGAAGQGSHAGSVLKEVAVESPTGGPLLNEVGRG